MASEPYPAQLSATGARTPDLAVLISVSLDRTQQAGLRGTCEC